MKRIIVPALAIIWAASVSVAYYKLYPFLGLAAGMPRLPHFVFTGNLLRHCAVLAAFLTSANGWGVLFWEHPHLTHSERLFMASTAGMGIISFLVICLDLLGIFHYLAYLLIIIAGIVIFLVMISRTHIDAIPGMARHVVLAGAVPMIAALVCSLAPPTQFDSLVYHLALPHKYLMDGTMSTSVPNMFFSFPQAMEMLFQTALALDADITANLISWACYALTGLGIGTLGRRYFSAPTGTVAAAVWLWTPAFMFLATGTYVDTGLALFVLAAAYACLLWRGSGHVFWLTACAAFSAGAFGVKYTAAAPAVILAGLVAAACPTWRSRARITMIFLAVFLAGILPWLIKNTWFLHNPIAPWGTSLFTSSIITAERASSYFAHIAGHGNLHGIRDILSLPWKLTAYGFQFGGSFDMIGPVFLVCVPFLFFKRGIDTIIRQLLIISALYAAVWFATGKVLRFLVPIMPFLCVFAAVGIRNIYQYSRRLGIAFFCIVCLALVHNLMLFHWTMAVIDPYATVLGNETRAQYLSSKVNGFAAIDTCVNRLPAGSKTLFFGDTRAYFCTGPSIVPTVFDEQPLVTDANISAGPDELFDRLRGRGVTHIYVNSYEVRRLGTEKALTDKGRTNLEAFKNDHLTIIYKDAHALVYEISA